MSKSKKSSREKSQNRVPSGAIANALANEADRGCVLVGTGFIDYRFEELFRAVYAHSVSQTSQNQKLIDGVLVGSMALLGSLWARTTVAYLSGLIDEELRNVVDAVRDLRNTFAHRPGPVVLDDDAMAPINGNLRGGKTTQLVRSLDELLKAGSEGSPWVFMGTKKRFSEPRLRFMHVSISIWQQLAVTARAIGPPLGK